MKSKLTELIQGYPDILQMHGFYADAEKMAVSFDLIIDFQSERKQQIRDEILKSMSEIYPEYRFNAVLDSDFSE